MKIKHFVLSALTALCVGFSMFSSATTVRADGEDWDSGTPGVIYVMNGYYPRNDGSSLKLEVAGNPVQAGEVINGAKVYEGIDPDSLTTRVSCPDVSSNVVSSDDVKFGITKNPDLLTRATLDFTKIDYPQPGIYRYKVFHAPWDVDMSRSFVADNKFYFVDVYVVRKDGDMKISSVSVYENTESFDGSIATQYSRKAWKMTLVSRDADATIDTFLEKAVNGSSVSRETSFEFELDVSHKDYATTTNGLPVHDDRSCHGGEYSFEIVDRNTGRVVNRGAFRYGERRDSVVRITPDQYVRLKDVCSEARIQYHEKFRDDTHDGYKTTTFLGDPGYESFREGRTTGITVMPPGGEVPCNSNANYVDSVEMTGLNAMWNSMVFLNQRDMPDSLGLRTNALPFILIIAGVGAIGFMIVKGRKKDDEDAE